MSSASGPPTTGRTHSGLPRGLTVVALALAWFGYFSPWIWPKPAALRLTGHDLVEWLSFAQNVRDGTFPISRLDLLWPLAGIALLTALHLPAPGRPWATALGAGLALVAAGLVLPGYPFLLNAHADPELRPQLLLGLATGAAALPALVLAALRPRPAACATAAVALLALAATVRAYALASPALADLFVRPAPIGYGLVLALAGFGWLAAAAAWRCLTLPHGDGRMPEARMRV